jgi:hypothetical protein
MPDVHHVVGVGLDVERSQLCPSASSRRHHPLVRRTYGSAAGGRLDSEVRRSAKARPDHAGVASTINARQHEDESLETRYHEHVGESL